jgi:hypothetical protein
MAMSKTTLPWIEDTATMFTDAELLFGVKATSNKLAVKPEFSWQEFRELDVSTRPSSWAAVGARREAKAARRAKGFANDSLMIDVVSQYYFYEMCMAAKGPKSVVGCAARKAAPFFVGVATTDFPQM